PRAGVVDQGGRDVHHVPAAALGEHRSDGAARDVEETAQVDPGHGVVVLVGVVGEWFAEEDPGVVHQRVHAAETRQCLFDDIGAGARPRQVATYGEHLGIL